jgi:hypothetical protein
VVVIGPLSPVWITPKLVVNEGDTRHLAARFSDLAVNAKADRIVVTRSEVGIVGVEAFHPAR